MYQAGRREAAGDGHTLHTGGVLTYDRIRHHIREDVVVHNQCQIILAHEVDPAFSDLLSSTATCRHVPSQVDGPVAASSSSAGSSSTHPAVGGGWSAASSSTHPAAAGGWSSGLAPRWRTPQWRTAPAARAPRWRVMPCHHHPDVAEHRGRGRRV